MDFAAVNSAILALEADIARLCASLERLRAEGAGQAAKERVTTELDLLLLAERAAQGERGRLLMGIGFPAALGWASRHSPRPIDTHAQVEHVLH